MQTSVPIVQQQEAMPHATRPSQTMDDFLSLHKAQLASSGIPERYWETLFTKMKNEVKVFSLHL